MDLLWPGFLLLLLLIPLILAVTIWILRRRRRFAVRYSSLALVHAALPRQSRLKRYLPLALFLLALVSLVVALGRPVAIVSVPSDQTSIILTIDVSRSMCSTDILPSRIEAAQAAALKFIQGQKASTRIGIVAFSGFAELVQPPTTDPELLQGAIESLMTGRRTAIGSGILQAIDAIAEIDQSIAPTGSDGSSPVKVTPVPKGAYVPDIIILLSDGASNTGPDPAGRRTAGRRPGGADLHHRLRLCQRLRISALPPAVLRKRAVWRRDVWRQWTVRWRGVWRRPVWRRVRRVPQGNR